MRRLIPILAGLAVLHAGPGRAAETPPPVSDQSVALSPVALPIVVEGHLANYIFVTVKVMLTPSANATALRDKEPYFRDALVRAGHRTPFVIKGDYNHIDEAKLKAAMFREASAIIGPGQVKSILLVEQTPQHYIPLQRPRPATDP